MDSRAFIITQSVKRLSNTLKKAVCNDYGYKLLSDDTSVTIKDMKNFKAAEVYNIFQEEYMIFISFIWNNDSVFYLRGVLFALISGIW